MELILRLIGRASQSRDGRPASGRGRSALRPAFLPTFVKDQRGAVAIYVGFLLTVLMGVLVIVFDVGRLTIVRSQAQNAADAAAIAAAVQLDGGDSARDRAEAVARGAANQMSNFQTTSGSPDIQIDTVVFYQDEGDLGGRGAPGCRGEAAEQASQPTGPTLRSTDKCICLGHHPWVTSSRPCSLGLQIMGGAGSQTTSQAAAIAVAPMLVKPSDVVPASAATTGSNISSTGLGCTVTSTNAALASLARLVALFYFALQCFNLMNGL